MSRVPPLDTGGQAGVSAASGDQPYATFGQRAMAFLIDGFVAWIPALVLDMANRELASRIVLGLANLAMGLAAATTGRSLGMAMYRIRLRRLDVDHPIGLGRGIVRHAVSWLSAVPLYLGCFWMLRDRRRQTWHDKVVGSIVVADAASPSLRRVSM